MHNLQIRLRWFGHVQWELINAPLKKIDLFKLNQWKVVEGGQKEYK